MSRPTLAGFISFLRAQGIYALYLPDDSEYLTDAFSDAMETVNPVIATYGGSDYAKAVYNLATDLVFNTAQDRMVDISSLAWNSSVVTVTSAESLGMRIGRTFYVQIADALPVAFDLPINSSRASIPSWPCVVTGDKTFTFPLATDPGTATATGVWQEVRNYEVKAKGNPVPFFQYWREIVWAIGSPTSGVMTGSGDAGTSGSIAVPETLQRFALDDLQKFKTPYGRAYLAISLKYGAPWGIV